jgi:hypothetical protein
VKSLGDLTTSQLNSAITIIEQIEEQQGQIESIPGGGPGISATMRHQHKQSMP